MSTFRYSLISDMHIDLGHQTDIAALALEEHVIVAGDTANGLFAADFINELKEHGHTVFAIDGNHEHYGNVRHGIGIREAEADFFQRIDQPRIVAVPDGLSLIGLNGWYDPYLNGNDRFWKEVMNDFHCAGEVRQLGIESARWLNSALASLEGRAIIVTHTSPVVDTLLSDEDDEDWDDIKVFYHNSYMHEILRRHADKILIWNHGHCHVAVDTVIDGVRVVSNPRGYPGQNDGWMAKTVSVTY